LITMLIADDHPLVRGALVDLFTGTGDIQVVAECADGSEVVPAALRTQPDVVLMDLVMPRMGGLQATEALLAVQPQARVVVLTGSFSPASVRQAQALGAKGYLLKDEDPAVLPEAVRTVASGGTAWSTPAAASLVRA
jgi:DNA-binding NarL/FixJ family response regulator